MDLITACRIDPEKLTVLRNSKLNVTQMSITLFTKSTTELYRDIP